MVSPTYFVASGQGSQLVHTGKARTPAMRKAPPKGTVNPFVRMAAKTKMRFTAVESGPVDAPMDSVGDEATPVPVQPDACPISRAASATALLDDFPLDALSAVDAWCSRAREAETVPSAGYPVLARRVEDAREFACAWAVLKSKLGFLTAVREGGCDPSVETQLVDAFYDKLAVAGWLYCNRTVFVADFITGYVSAQSSLDDSLRHLLVAASRPAQDHFAKLPHAVGRVSDIIHEALVRSDRCLKFDSSRMMFENCTAQLSAAGIDTFHTPEVVTDRPVLPRSHIPARLDMADSRTPPWPGAGFLDASLLPLLGALMHPSHLRQVDIRPVFILATCPKDAIHPVVWAAHTFCNHAVTTGLHSVDSDFAPRVHEPYILYIDAAAQPLTLEHVLQIKAALSKRMSVIVRSSSVPAILLLESEEYLRLCAVHVQVPSSPSDAVLQQAMVHLLPAAVGAYRREPPAAKRLLTFLDSREVVPRRVNSPGSRKSAVLLFVEMLQGDMGIQFRPGGTLSLAQCQEAFDVYQAMRYPSDEAALSCVPHDVLAAVQAFREYFGYVRDVKDVVFLPDTSVFTNLSRVSKI